MLPAAAVLEEVLIVLAAVTEAPRKFSCLELLRLLLEEPSDCGVATREEAGPTARGSNVEQIR